MLGDKGRGIASWLRAKKPLRSVCSSSKLMEITLICGGQDVCLKSVMPTFALEEGEGSFGLGNEDAGNDS